MSPITIVLADDHAVVRAGIRAMLECLPGIVIVGEAANGRDALAQVEQHQPQILMTDITMPEMNGLETTTRVVKEFPNVKVIVLSMHSAEEYVWQALKAGAVGYLLKDVEIQELGIAIEAVEQGKTYLTPSVSKRVVETYMQRMGNRVNVADVLTPRQREILQLIAEGKSLKLIASQLNLNVKTVETHRTLLMNRLDIHDTAGLVRYALRTGLITSES